METPRDLGPVDKINAYMLTNSPAILRGMGMLASKLLPPIAAGEAVWGMYVDIAEKTIGLLNALGVRIQLPVPIPRTIADVYQNIGVFILFVAQHNEPVAHVLLQFVMNPESPAALVQAATQLYKYRLERYLYASVVFPVGGLIIVGVYDAIDSLLTRFSIRNQIAIAKQDSWIRNLQAQAGDISTQIAKARRLIIDTTDSCVTSQAKGLEALLATVQAQMNVAAAQMFNPSIAEAQLRQASKNVGAVSQVITNCGKQTTDRMEADAKAQVVVESRDQAIRAAQSQLVVGQQQSQQLQSRMLTQLQLQRSKVSIPVVAAIISVGLAAYFTLKE